MTASLHRLRCRRTGGGVLHQRQPARARPGSARRLLPLDGGGVVVEQRRTVVRHGAAIDVASFRISVQLAPATGSRWSAVRGPGHWAALTAPWTPGKSGPSSSGWPYNPSTSARIEAAHRTAVERALSLSTAEGSSPDRTGAGGTEQHRPHT